MEPFPWWTDEHVKLAKEVSGFVMKNIDKAEEAVWTLR